MGRFTREQYERIKASPKQAKWAYWNQLARHDFATFARLGWRVIEPRPIIWSWHLQAICDHLQAVREGLIQRLAIHVPPRMTKSSLVSVLFPAWWWTSEPERRVLCGSAVEDVVYRDALKCQEVVDSPWYQAAFNIEWGWKRSQNAKSHYASDAGGHRISKTVGQKLIGVDGDALIVDDPLDTKAARLDRAQLREHVRWYDEDATGRLTSESDPEILIMQRLHEADIGGHVAERVEEDGWNLLIIPAIFDGIQRSRTALGWQDPREPGELLCSRLTKDFLDRRKRRLGPRRFAAQYQQLPAPAEGAVFRKDWLQFWEAQTLPSSFDWKVASWDTSWKEGRSNDWCVGQVWGVRGANLYLLEQIRKKMGYDEQLQYLIDQNNRHLGLRKILVETGGKSTGKSIVENMKAILPGIEGVSHQGDTKESRAESVTPRWAAKQVYIPHPHQFSWVEKDFIPELLGFPVARHDDQVDAMTQAIQYINENPTPVPIVFSLGS